MRIRSTTESDRDLFVQTLHRAFGLQYPPSTEGASPWWSAFEMERGLFALDHGDADGTPVGTAGAYTFELTLPGGTTLPAPGVTAVGVAPTHRRRGVLTALMRRQLDQFTAAGEAVSVLLASEAVIYRRFGYGPASHTQRLSVPRHRAAFTQAQAPSEGTVELQTRADTGELISAIYDRYRRAQPGALSRPAHWWTLGAGQPPVSHAHRYIAVHRDADGTPDGYASYSVGATDLATLARTLTVDEIVALNDVAENALARYCLDHDLVTSVVFANLGPDHPLAWWLADFRATQVIRQHDGLWVRLLDIPRALAARRYLADGQLVLHVDDPFLGASHRLLLQVEDGIAACRPTGAPAELTLDVSDLASLYLGGVTASVLVRAGRVTTHHPTAATRADTLFRSDRAPHCLHWF
ncbi:acetyltransferase [Streptomyces rubellomurinus subsp. indigoferus]|nr:acetyltransferase [Streptomyces rubellomurinus subsp. indigoferus]